MLACKALSFFMIFSHTYVVTVGSYPLPSWFPLSLTDDLPSCFMHSITQIPQALMVSLLHLWFIFPLSFRLHVWEKISSTVCFSEFRFFSYHDFQKAPTLQRIIKFTFVTVEHMLVNQHVLLRAGEVGWPGTGGQSLWRLYPLYFVSDCCLPLYFVVWTQITALSHLA